MSDIDVTTDLEQATLTVTSHFRADPERIWQLWADPRELERWWGPEPYPATVTEHDLRPDGHVRYHMTSPEGERHPGYWNVVEVEPPHRLVFVDGFADDGGQPADDMPTSRSEVLIEAVGEGRTRMTIVSRYATAEQLETVLQMGVEQGIRIAVGQIEGLLAEDRVA